MWFKNILFINVLYEAMYASPIDQIWIYILETANNLGTHVSANASILKLIFTLIVLQRFKNVIDLHTSENYIFIYDWYIMYLIILYRII